MAVAAARCPGRAPRRPRARRTSPAPRPSRSSRRTAAGRPCRAGRSAAGRRAWRGSGRGGSRGPGSRCAASPDWTVCTSWTAREAVLVDATGAPSEAQRDPDDAERRSAARSAQSRWPAATRVTRISASTGMREQPDEDHDDGGDGDVRARPADRVAQRLDADPHVGRVGDGVERPVEGRDEPHVEELHHHEHRQDCSGDPASTRRRRLGSRTASTRTTSSSRGSRTNAAASSWLSWFGATRAAQTRSSARTVSATASARVQRRALRRGRRRHSHHTHSPIGRRERDERDEEGRLHGRTGQDVGGGDREHDALRRRDDLAPAARWERRAHPRQQPARRAGTGSAPPRSRAPTRRGWGRRRR